MKVGYVPYSQNLNHPGDRRRLNSWATSKNLRLNITKPLESDLLVLSGNANFNFWIPKAKKIGVPTVIDIVDGYISYKPPLIEDCLRNLVRTYNNSSSLRWLKFSDHVRYAAQIVDAVIVPSEEMQHDAKDLNKNTFVIQDNFKEICEFKEISNNWQLQQQSNSTRYFFWEGFGYTLKHFGHVSHILDDFMYNYNWGMKLVTQVEFTRWGGYIGKIKTEDIIKKLFPKSFSKIDIIPWSVQNLVRQAELCSFALIPINLNDKFGYAKSENKLLSMFYLGLPTLASPIPSYVRLMKSIKLEHFLVDNWDSKIKNLGSEVDKPLYQDCLLKIEAYIEYRKSQINPDLEWEKLINKLLK